MVTSLRLSGMYTVHVNSKRNFSIGEKTFNIDKDIPIVRYSFKAYEEAEIAYIKKMMELFEKQTHIVEVNVTSNLGEVLAKLEEHLPNVAKFIRVEVTDEVVKNGIDCNNDFGFLMMACGHAVDQVVLVDKSTSLDYLHCEKIIDTLSKRMGLSKIKFGICESPLSMGERACLTAVKAREIMSKYGDESAPLPSANHQSMNECGCIRYLQIDADTKPMAEKVTNTTSESGEKTVRAVKKPKYNQRFNFF